MSDLISRQAAIDYVDDVPYIKMHPNIGLLWKAWIEQLPSAQSETCAYWDRESNFCALHRPSAQPEPEEFEWCHDCKEYDRERHCCHRWTKVIRNTVDELKQTQWIPVSERLPEYFEPVITWDGHCYFVEKRIPYIRDDDGNTIKSEWWVSDDYDEEESEYYPNLRDGAAIAWMPLPKPYEVKE